MELQVGRRLAKIVLGAAIALVALPMLAGCVERFGGGPNALSRSGNELLIAVYSSIDVREIYGQIETEDGPQRLVDLKSSAQIDFGSILRPEAPEGLEGYFDAVDPETVQTLEIKFEGIGMGASWNSTFGADSPIEIPDNGWLQTSGKITDAPRP